ncbi:MAG: hypothetical protein PHU68_01110 [Paludibacter sp.]|nr:hypothetical protein [Paludibacter sp.]
MSRTVIVKIEADYKEIAMELAEMHKQKHEGLVPMRISAKTVILVKPDDPRYVEYRISQKGKIHKEMDVLRKSKT